MSDANYPDDMRNEDIKYVEGMRSVDIAADKFEDRKDEDVLNEFFFEDYKDRSIRTEEVVDWLIKNNMSLLWTIIKEQDVLDEEFKAYKDEWIETKADELEDAGR